VIAVSRAEPAPPPTSVLDASALLALLRDEQGSTIVIEALAAGAAVSVFNWAEVLSKTAADGADPSLVASRLNEHPETTDVTIRLEAPDADECIAIARLRPITRPQGLSLADRACLTLANRLGVPALTADRTWAAAQVDAEVRLIR
jgi:PIN domain nuclease of toxin-antitoxin system